MNRKVSPETSDPKIQGVWTGAAGGAAGTYAIIIGISQYDYLDGTDRCYGLRSLFVSARTAKAFFDWLCCEYDTADCPLQKCWLLLAPTDTEARADADLTPTAQGFTNLTPIFENIRLAIGRWFNTLKALPASDAANSRAIFFYSGHGIEVDKDKQLLLPCDYLDPDNSTLNRAVSTYNIHSALGSTAVSRQFFFVDACRNDIPQFRTFQNLDGETILDVQRGQSNRTSPILYGSSPGAEAWQPTSPPGLSFFGQSLLDALKLHGTGNKLSVVEQNGLSLINLLPLYEYVNEAVQENLLQHRINQFDPICLGGIVKGNPTLARVPRMAGPTAAAEGVAGMGLAQAEGVGSTAVAEPAASTTSPSPVTAKITELRIERPFKDADLATVSYDVAHQAFGHEDVTEFYRSLRALRFENDAWSSDSDPITVVSVDRSTEGDLCTIAFEVGRPSLWHWLSADALPLHFAFLLPPTSDTDAVSGDKVARFRLAVGRNKTTADPNDTQLKITVAQASLSGESTGVLGEAAQYYDRYRSFAQLSDTALDDLQTFGEDNMKLAKESPASGIAANMAALILLRGGREDMLNFLPALIEDYKLSSDAAILAIERMARRPEYFSFEELGRMLQILLARGTPFMSEALAYGMKRAGPLTPTEWANAGIPLQRLGQLGMRLRAMELAYRRGGFFTSFASTNLRLGPDGLAFSEPVTIS